MNRGGVKRTMRGNVREAEVFFNIAQRRKKSISPEKKHGKQFVFAVRTFSGKQARKNALSPDDPAPRKIEACQPAQREGRQRNPEEMTAEKKRKPQGRGYFDRIDRLRHGDPGEGSRKAVHQCRDRRMRTASAERKKVSAAGE